jgi:hypothetical protein
VLVEAVAGDEIDSDAAIPRYPLHSYPHVVLISPLHTPCRRHINTGLQGLASLEDLFGWSRVRFAVEIF